MLTRETKNAPRILARKLLEKQVFGKPRTMEENMEKCFRMRC
jgi:hypothetical protein